MWEKLLNELVSLGTSFGLKLLGAIVLLIVGLRLVKQLKRWIKRSKKLQKVDDSVRSFMASFVAIVLDVLLFVSAAMILGVPAASFITLLASGGVAIGLAMQGALSNFAGGLMILLFKPFKVGDYIEAGSESGMVKDITVVYTVLTTVDNKRVTIPNGTIMSSNITNYSAEKLRRVDLTFTTAYDCDVETTKAVLTEVVTAHPLVLADPAPFVRLSAHGDSALVFTVRAWCQTDDYWTVHFDLTEAVKAAFDRHGITIPFPQVDVHMNP